MKDKVALITGAASGIGRATAEVFAERGARIIGLDRDAGHLQEVIAGLPKGERGHIALVKDLRSAEVAQSVVPDVLEKAGGLDIVVNAAGMCYFTRMNEISIEEYNEVMDVNVRALFLISVAAAEAMSSKGGKIINLGSNAGRKGRALSAHYAASKAAVKNITESLALAYGPNRITVNTVCPGPTVTPMWDGNFEGLKKITGKQPEEFWETWSRQTPLGRVGQPADVVELICFLASDGGGYITGQEINVCGGFMLTS